MLVKEIEVKSVLSKSNLPVCEYSVNPYVGCPHACKYCYASFMKRFTNHLEPWGAFLDVKYWPEIKNPEKYRGKELFIGSVTDPYNPREETYQRTRALLLQLQGSGAKLSIATKSDLISRDLELIKSFPDARVSWSVNTLDEGFKDDMDCAVSIRRRLAANVTVLPGVHIGDNSVIGAGSVVTRDIPANVLAVGSPARVLREIGPEDDIYYDHGKLISENLI